METNDSLGPDLNQILRYDATACTAGLLLARSLWRRLLFVPAHLFFIYEYYNG